MAISHNVNGAVLAHIRFRYHLPLPEVGQMYRTEAAFGLHPSAVWDYVKGIIVWAQEHFRKPLSVNTVHRYIYKYKLKLYHAK